MSLIEAPRRGRPNQGKFTPSEEQVSKLTEMYQSGHSYTEMAHYLHKHRNTVVRILPVLGLTGRYTKWTPEWIAKLKDCFDRGLTSPVVEREWNGAFTSLAIRSKWKELGWKREGVRLIYRPRTNSPMNSWDTDRLALLRQYWDLGMSASHIAAALGHGLTRNAILGKAYRIGLPPRREARPRLTPEERRERAKKWYWANREKALARLRKANAKRGKKEPAVTLLVKWGGKLKGAPEPTPASAVPFMEITHGQCRWVYGKPQGAETLFCGEPVIKDQSYCAHHYIRTRTTEGQRATFVSKRASRVVGGYT
jgi:GcrA cell cycle regulator